MTRRKYGDRAICQFCDLEIEFIGNRHWQDRGGEEYCHDGKRPNHLHKPIADEQYSSAA